MLARTTQIIHPNGDVIKTPLLVPSFSSKGFRTASDKKSELRDLASYSVEFLEESMLISAWDLRHGLLPPIDELPNPSLTFIDSGGYELSDSHDLDSVYRFESPNAAESDWTRDEHAKLLNQWPEHRSAVIVSYDIAGQDHSLVEQLTEGRALFRKFPNQMSDILLKPASSSSSYLHTIVKEVAADATCLRGFNIIGVTEKELGSSLQDRILNIVKLRTALDDAGITSPIHVFGGLDPLTCSLYFVAGAEIFDGLTWLRYFYKDGASQAIMSHMADLPFSTRLDKIRGSAITANLYTLDSLKHQMTTFATTGDASIFKHHQEQVTTAMQVIANQTGRR